MIRVTFRSTHRPAERGQADGFGAADGLFEKLVAVATVITVTTATMMTIRSRDRIFIVLAGTMRVCRLEIRRADLRIRSREVFMGTGAFTD